LGDFASLDVQNTYRGSDAYGVDVNDLRRINPLNGGSIPVRSFFGWCAGMAAMPYLTVTSNAASQGVQGTG
ncbi:hypothetical protein ACR9PT_15240, partial [Piscirickettsia salmonis]|uniref:hypothetical protein n=1 Tax=Piscirickettsia salmonis TaxID=1238 RepID=UPI003EBA4940